MGKAKTNLATLLSIPILVGGVVKAQNSEPVMPVKERTIVATNQMPVKTLRKTYDSNLKANKEYSSEVVSYTTLPEGINARLTYLPSENVFYDENSSKLIQEKEQELREQRGDLGNFYGDRVYDPHNSPNNVPYNYTPGDTTTPGKVHLNYYASGDIDENNVLNWNDWDMTLGSTSDKADINMNGIPGEQADKNKLKDYLLDNIAYLPAHWDLLQTETERINTLENALAIDSTEVYKPGWYCDDYSAQFMINFAGVENAVNSGINFNVYDSTNNARFNLPVYEVGTMANGGIPHAINSIFVGDDATGFTSWYFIEPQNDERVYPGDVSMDPNSYANNERFCYYWNEYFQYFSFSTMGPIEFDLTNGNASISFQSQFMPEQRDSVQLAVHLQGEKPVDTLINYGSGTGPEQTGWPTNVGVNVADTVYSDSTNQIGAAGDSTFYNYNIWRNWVLKGSDLRVDTTLGTIDWHFNGSRPAQLIEVRDTENPIVTNWSTGSSSVYYSQVDSVPLAEFSDNSGVVDVSRLEYISTQDPDTNNCEHYEYTETFTDRGEDPTGNLKDTTFTRNVTLDPNEWTFVPMNQQISYSSNLNLSPENTGGWATATNPAGVVVNVDYEDASTRNPDTMSCQHYNWHVDRTWEATNEPCGNPIYDEQDIDVIKPMALVYDSFPDDITIALNDPKDPSFTGEPTGHDTIVSWFPTTYDYWDELISATQADSIWDRHFELEESICGTSTNSDSIQRITRDLSTGIKENKLEDILRTYPNPTSGITKVELNSPYKNIGKINAEVYNSQGKLIDLFKEEFFQGKNEFEIDLSKQPNGLYFIQFSSQGKILEQEKVLKISN